MDRRLLSQAFGIASLYSLNEKLFGFNKQGQQDADINEIIKQMPSCTINGKGQLIWMDDVLANLVEFLTGNNALGLFFVS